MAIDITPLSTDRKEMAMSRSTLLDIRDWCGVAAAFGAILFMTVAPHGTPDSHEPRAKAGAEARPEVYASRN
jgi:hypothetical protein